MPRKKRIWLLLVFLLVFSAPAHGVRKFFFLIGSGCWGVTAHQTKEYFDHEHVIRATRHAYENVLINGSGTDLSVRLLDKKLAYEEVKRNQQRSYS